MNIIISLSDNFLMRQLYQKHRGKIIFCLFSLIFYYIIDLSFITLTVYFLEFAVIAQLLSYFFMFITFLCLIWMTTFKRPMIIYGILIIATLHLTYNTFSDYIKTSLYYHCNKDDLQLLIEMVSEIDGNDGIIRDQFTEQSFTIYYWDIFLSEHKNTLWKLTDKLNIHTLTKHPDYYEFELAGYSWRREETITLVRYNSPDAVSRDKNHYSMDKKGRISNNWYYKYYFFT